MPSTIATTRFNRDTWGENAVWRRENNWKGCVYGSPRRMGERIHLEADVYVLEMNNDENRIMGIGKAFNRPVLKDKEKYKIYSERNYNRYIYSGKARIDRADMTPAEEKLMWVLDMLVFKGSRHLKRGHGVARVPSWIVENRQLGLEQAIQAMFWRRDCGDAGA